MNPQTDSVAAQRAGEKSVAFAAALFGRVAAAADTNVFMSPYSVGAALALTMEGAKGDTAGQLKKALGYASGHDLEQLHHDLVSLIHSLNKVEGVELSVANALWVSNDFQIDEDYAKRAQELLSEARNLDFKSQAEESRQHINSWVEAKTKDKIKHLLATGSINADVQLVITNAIYFKGAWAHPFDKSSTRDQDFHLLGNAGTKTVKMMQQDHLSARLGRFDDHDMVQLPYEGQDTVMLILLPHQNSPSALQAVVSDENLRKLNQRQMNKRDVNIKLPRFKFEYEVELTERLQEMGISLPFTDNADFSAMVAPDSPAQGDVVPDTSNHGRQLRIGKVLHKVFVEVNEEGTEAAAATFLEMSNCLPINFVVDRPFAFVIYNTRLQCPLFVGKVVDPTTTA